MSKIIVSKIMGLLFILIIVSGAFAGGFAATYFVPTLFRGSTGPVVQQARLALKALVALQAPQAL